MDRVNKSESINSNEHNELQYAEADVDRSMARFSAAVDELNERILHTINTVRRPQEKLSELQSWVTAPENRNAMIVGGISLMAGWIAFRRLRRIYS